MSFDLMKQDFRFFVGSGPRLNHRQIALVGRDETQRTMQNLQGARKSLQISGILLT